MASDADEVFYDAETGEADTDKSFDEEINGYREIFENKGIGGLQRALEENSNKWRNIGLHVAVTGSSGSGKSSFINALRNVNAEDEDGAKVGVTETTMKLTSYKHPKYPNFIVWDMPGVGTPHFTRDNYIECAKFDRYDFFIILSKGRFTEEDLWLAKEIKNRGKRFYFIRTNIGSDIYNDSCTNTKEHSPQKIIEAVRQNCQQFLVEAGFDKTPVFLVDNIQRQGYDFGVLELQLVQDADSLQIEAMTLSLSVLTKDVLQAKKEVLEGRIWKKTTEIATLFDNYNEQKRIFDEEMSLYREQFSLDEKSLEDIKHVLTLTDDSLKKYLFLFDQMSAETITKLGKELYSLFGHPKRLIKTILFLIRKWSWLFFKQDSKVSRALLGFTYFELHRNLEKYHATALKVYNKNAQKLLVTSLKSFQIKK